MKNHLKKLNFHLELLEKDNVNIIYSKLFNIETKKNVHTSFFCLHRRQTKGKSILPQSLR